MEYLLFPLVFMAIGIAIANAKGRSGLAWGLFCLLSGPIGIIVLLLSADGKRPEVYVAPVPASDASTKKWSILKDVDEEIRKAAERLAALAPELENELAEKYMELGDKSYLGALAKNIEEKFHSANAAKKMKEEELNSRPDPTFTDEEAELGSGNIGRYYYVRTKQGEYIVTQNDTFVGKASSYKDLIRRFGR